MFYYKYGREQKNHAEARTEAHNHCLSSGEQLSIWFQSCVHVKKCCLQQGGGLWGGYILALQGTLWRILVDENNLEVLVDEKLT